MKTQETIAVLKNAHMRDLFGRLYGSGESVIEDQTKRYASLIEAFKSRYGDDDIRLFSSPGRSEIGGNHTDHNLGKVLAASIQMDCIGAVSTAENEITINDLTYNEDYTIDIRKTDRVPGEKGSIALVRGIVEGFKRAGFKIGGFRACFTSRVIAAAGVSSSASFEMMICLILSSLYNEGSIPVNRFASIGQFAENAYWDKASGLLDQMACAVGGLIAIDFENPAEPAVEKVDFDFAAQDYKVLIVNTGKSHADLSKEYSSIPNEMKSVARLFEQETLRGITEDMIVAQLPRVRAECGDRAVLRAFHFFEENRRVDMQTAALRRGDFAEFLRLITESGNSSWKWLQNTYVTAVPQEQSVPVCLALTELFIGRKGAGACRIHGGGFAGVILAFLPSRLVDEYTAWMNTALGVDTAGEKSPVYAMSIRPLGAVEIK